MASVAQRASGDEAASHEFATKRDLAELKVDLKDTLASKVDFKELKADLKELKADVIKVASIVVGALASAGIITAAFVGLAQLFG